MKRWRLIVMPAIVLSVGLLAASFRDTPKEDVPRPVPGTPTAFEKKPAPADEPVEKILATDPVRFLEMSLDHYDKTIQSYTLTFDKHERVGGKLLNPQTTDVRFREKPHSVHMTWTKGEDRARKVVYVEGANDDKMLVRPLLPLGFVGPVVTRDVDGADTKASGRFNIADFGFKRSSQRSLASMKRAKEKGTLHVKYEGIVTIEKLKYEPVHKLVRTPYDPLEEDGLNELTLYFDTKNWLQVGSVLKNAQGELLGEYWFTNVVINPTFTDKQFSRDSL